jgi:uncharacterized membrane protein YhaH (DUF805 family)
VTGVRDVGIVTELDVAALVLGLLCLLAPTAALITLREDRTRSMKWVIAGFAVLGAGSVALGVWHWRWLIAVMVIGGLTVLVAGAAGEWRGQ